MRKAVISRSQPCSQLSPLPKASTQAQQPPPFPKPQTVYFPPQTFDSAPPRCRRGASYHLRKVLHGMALVSPLPFSPPKAPQPSGTAEQTALPGACPPSRRGKRKAFPGPPLLRVPASVAALRWASRAQRKRGDSQRHLAHVSCARPKAGAVSGEQLPLEQRRQNRGALTEKGKPRRFQRKARFPSLRPGRTGNIPAKSRADCSAAGGLRRSARAVSIKL